MKMGESRAAPRLAAKYWDEYSGKQRLLSTFFGKGSNPPATPSPPKSATVMLNTTTSLVTNREASATASSLPAAAMSSPSAPKPSTQPILSKRKSASQSSGGPIKKTKTADQQKLSSFFAKPRPAGSSSPTPVDSIVANLEEQEDADYRLALALSQDEPVSQTQKSPAAKAKSKAAWSQIMAPLEPPRCLVHNEPAKEWTTNKPGPNKGKTFYLCSR